MGSSLPRIAAGALIVLLGCAGPSIHYDYDANTHFSTYQTFAWQLPAQGPPDGAEGFNNTIMSGRVQRAVEAELGSKGYQTAGGIVRPGFPGQLSPPWRRQPVASSAPGPGLRRGPPGPGDRGSRGRPAAYRRGRHRVGSPGFQIAGRGLASHRTRRPGRIGQSGTGRFRRERGHPQHAQALSPARQLTGPESVPAIPSERRSRVPRVPNQNAIGGHSICPNPCWRQIKKYNKFIYCCICIHGLETAFLSS